MSVWDPRERSDLERERDQLTTSVGLGAVLGHFRYTWHFRATLTHLPRLYLSHRTGPPFSDLLAGLGLSSFEQASSPPMYTHP